MNTVFHVNDQTKIAGGVEVYISQLLPLLRIHNWGAHWLAISRIGELVRIECDDTWLEWHGQLRDLPNSPFGRIAQKKSNLIHAHSLADPMLVRALLDLAPTIRTIHEPRVFCPGQGKFWARTERACRIPAGLHCFLHAYTEGCCNRHPKRLIPAYQNTQFELREASQRYAKMIAVSNYIRDEAILSGVPPQIVEVVNNFTLPCQDLTSTSTQPRIVFAGRLSKSKGVHYLLKSFKHVTNAVPGAHLDLLGDGIDQKQFVVLVETLKIADQVTFHGWADRKTLNHHLDIARAIAFPSIYPEAFGISGIEAMMRGKPVVGYDVGGVSDWLDDGVTGTLVPAKDIEGFASALSNILTDPVKAKFYGDNAQKAAVEKFSPDAHLAKLLPIYEEAIANTGSKW